MKRLILLISSLLSIYGNEATLTKAEGNNVFNLNVTYNSTTGDIAISATIQKAPEITTYSLKWILNNSGIEHELSTSQRDNIFNGNTIYVVATEALIGDNSLKLEGTFVKSIVGEEELFIDIKSDEEPFTADDPVLDIFIANSHHEEDHYKIATNIVYSGGWNLSSFTSKVNQDTPVNLQTTAPHQVYISYSGLPEGVDNTVILTVEFQRNGFQNRTASTIVKFSYGKPSGLTVLTSFEDTTNTINFDEPFQFTILEGFGVDAGEYRYLKQDLTWSTWDDLESPFFENQIGIITSHKDYLLTHGPSVIYRKEGFIEIGQHIVEFRGIGFTGEYSDPVSISYEVLATPGSSQATSVDWVATWSEYPIAQLDSDYGFRVEAGIAELSRYKLGIKLGDNDNIVWGNEYPISNLITKSKLESLFNGVSDLNAGTYTFYISGINGFGYWVSDANAAEVSFTIMPINIQTTEVFTKKTTSTASDFSRDESIKNIKYFDGSSKLVQEVAKQRSLFGYDIVNTFNYNDNNLLTGNSLPYVSNLSSGAFDFNYIENRKTYYETAGYNSDKKLANTSFYETTHVYENSPLNRLVESNSYGEAWQYDSNNPNRHTIKYEYSQNVENEVRKFNSDASSTSFYSANKLFKEKITDENGSNSYVFKNHSGNAILKLKYIDNGTITKVQTYYIYDEFNNLRFILPPEMVVTIPDSGLYTVSQEDKDKWVTEFIYDSQNRLIKKRTPETGFSYIVYDNLDRAVLTQDESLKSKNQWIFTKYDYFGRAIYSGIVFHINTPEQMQAALLEENTYWETRNTNDVGFDSEIGYTKNKSLSFLNIEINNLLNISYYDDYNNPSMLGVTLPTNVYIGTSEISEELTPFTRINGKVTASRTRILPRGENFLSHMEFPIVGNYSFSDSEQIVFTQEEDIEILPPTTISVSDSATVEIAQGLSSMKTAEFLSTYFFYDKQGRTIKSVVDNVLGGKDINFIQYDWVGKIVKSVSSHYTIIDNLQSPESKFVSTPKYDDLNRAAYTIEERFFNGVVQENPKAGGSNIWVPSLILYNDLGKAYATIVNPKPSDIVKNSNGIFEMSTNNYSYIQETEKNERGWLTKIKVTDKSSNIIFNENLAYNTDLGISEDHIPQYNGNITAVEILQKKIDASSNNYIYNYTYDELNQLVDANYFDKINSSNNNHYSTSDLDYDLNGNIKALTRQSASGRIDQLVYNYKADKPNQVLYISDAGTSLGFENREVEFVEGGENLLDKYLYDINGNMIEDKNKGITLKYNHLNLPVEINFSDGRKLVNRYLSNGVRYERELIESAETKKKFVYSGSFIYEKNEAIENFKLHFMSVAGGRIVDNGASIADLEFFVQDHLGNTRQVLKENGSIMDVIQDNHYYAFGMKTDQSADISTNRSSYNGKELDADLNWYHYGARFYDPAVGRWWSVDAADEFFSPYNYVSNTPLNAIDPDGNRTWYIAGTWGADDPIFRNDIGNWGGGSALWAPSYSQSFFGGFGTLFYEVHSTKNRFGIVSNVYNKISKDLQANPLQKGEPLLLTAHSAGVPLVVDVATSLISNGDVDASKVVLHLYAGAPLNRPLPEGIKAVAFRSVWDPVSWYGAVVDWFSGENIDTEWTWSSWHSGVKEDFSDESQIAGNTAIE